MAVLLALCGVWCVVYRLCALRACEPCFVFANNLRVVNAGPLTFPFRLASSSLAVSSLFPAPALQLPTGRDRWSSLLSLKPFHTVYCTAPGRDYSTPSQNGVLPDSIAFLSEYIRKGGSGSRFTFHISHVPRLTSQGRNAGIRTRGKRKSGIENVIFLGRRNVGTSEAQVIQVLDIQHSSFLSGAEHALSLPIPLFPYTRALPTSSSPSSPPQATVPQPS